jgi:gas vesicle protein
VNNVIYLWEYVRLLYTKQLTFASNLLNNHLTLKNMETSNNMGKIIGALLLGAAVGGTLGILFAPDKGSKTRKNILSQGNELTDVIKDKFDDFLDGVKKEIETAKEKATDFMKDGAAKKETHKAS